jgi:glutamate 5-kinase
MATRSSRLLLGCLLSASALAVACTSSSGMSAYAVAQTDACSCVYDKDPSRGITCNDAIAKNALARTNVSATCTSLEGKCAQEGGTYGFGTKCSTATFLGRCETQTVTTSGEEVVNNAIVYADAAGTQLAAAKATCTGTNKTWTGK